MALTLSHMRKMQDQPSKTVLFCAAGGFKWSYWHIAGVFINLAAINLVANKAYSPRWLLIMQPS
jgi:hypothetical protein